MKGSLFEDRPRILDLCCGAGYKRYLFKKDSSIAKLKANGAFVYNIT